MSGSGNARSSSTPNPPDIPLPPDRHVNNTRRGFAPNYKLSSIPKLTGPENYRAWRDISEYVLGLYNCWRIVTGDEVIPGKEEDDDLIDGFRDRYQYASAYFL